VTGGFEPALVLERPRASARFEMRFEVPDLDAPPPSLPEAEPAPDLAAIAAEAAAAEAAEREAMLEAARQAGFADGEAAGRAAEAASRAAREAAALEAIALRLAETGAGVAEAVGEAAAELAGVLLAALGAALPAAVERLAPESAAWVAARLAPLLEEGVAVTLHVAPGCGEAAAARIDDPRLRIAEDAGLAPGAVRASWRGGGAEFSLGAQQAAIADLLRSFGLSSRTEEK
jgi:flagellar biosynthesis/type III secretory pathway protein FliH